MAKGIVRAADRVAVWHEAAELPDLTPLGEQGPTSTPPPGDVAPAVSKSKKFTAPANALGKAMSTAAPPEGGFHGPSTQAAEDWANKYPGFVSSYLKPDYSDMLKAHIGEENHAKFLHHAPTPLTDALTKYQQKPAPNSKKFTGPANSLKKLLEDPHTLTEHVQQWMGQGQGAAFQKTYLHPQYADAVKAHLGDKNYAELQTHLNGPEKAEEKGQAPKKKYPVDQAQDLGIPPENTIGFNPNDPASISDAFKQISDQVTKAKQKKQQPQTLTPPKSYYEHMMDTANGGFFEPEDQDYLDTLKHPDFQKWFEGLPEDEQNHFAHYPDEAVHVHQEQNKSQGNPYDADEHQENLAQLAQAMNINHGYYTEVPDYQAWEHGLSPDDVQHYLAHPDQAHDAFEKHLTDYYDDSDDDVFGDEDGGLDEGDEEDYEPPATSQYYEKLKNVAPGSEGNKILNLPAFKEWLHQTYPDIDNMQVKPSPAAMVKQFKKEKGQAIQDQVYGQPEQHNKEEAAQQGFGDLFKREYSPNASDNLVEQLNSYTPEQLKKYIDSQQAPITKGKLQALYDKHYGRDEDADQISQIEKLLEPVHQSPGPAGGLYSGIKKIFPNVALDPDASDAEMKTQLESWLKHLPAHEQGGYSQYLPQLQALYDQYFGQPQGSASEKGFGDKLADIVGPDILDVQGFNSMDPKAQKSALENLLHGFHDTKHFDALQSLYDDLYPDSSALPQQQAGPPTLDAAAVLGYFPKLNGGNPQQFLQMSPEKQESQLQEWTNHPDPEISSAAEQMLHKYFGGADPQEEPQSYEEGWKQLFPGATKAPTPQQLEKMLNGSLGHHEKYPQIKALFDKHFGTGAQQQAASPGAPGLSEELIKKHFPSIGEHAAWWMKQPDPKVAIEKNIAVLSDPDGTNYMPDTAAKWQQVLDEAFGGSPTAGAGVSPTAYPGASFAKVPPGFWGDLPSGFLDWDKSKGEDKPAVPKAGVVAFLESKGYGPDELKALPYSSESQVSQISLMQDWHALPDVGKEMFAEQEAGGLQAPDIQVANGAHEVKPTEWSDPEFQSWLKGQSPESIQYFQQYPLQAAQVWNKEKKEPEHTFDPLHSTYDEDSGDWHHNEASLPPGFKAYAEEGGVPLSDYNPDELELALHHWDKKTPEEKAEWNKQDLDNFFDGNFGGKTFDAPELAKEVANLVGGNPESLNIGGVKIKEMTSEQAKKGLQTLIDMGGKNQAAFQDLQSKYFGGAQGAPDQSLGEALLDIGQDPDGGDYHPTTWDSWTPEQQKDLLAKHIDEAKAMAHSENPAWGPYAEKLQKVYDQYFGSGAQAPGSGAYSPDAAWEDYKKIFPTSLNSVKSKLSTPESAKYWLESLLSSGNEAALANKPAIQQMLDKHFGGGAPAGGQANFDAAAGGAGLSLPHWDAQAINANVPSIFTTYEDTGVSADNKLKPGAAAFLAEHGIGPEGSWHSKGNPDIVSEWQAVLDDPAEIAKYVDMEKGGQTPAKAPQVAEPYNPAQAWAAWKKIYPNSKNVDKFTSPEEAKAFIGQKLALWKDQPDHPKVQAIQALYDKYFGDGFDKTKTPTPEEMMEMGISSHAAHALSVQKPELFWKNYQVVKDKMAQEPDWSPPSYWKEVVDKLTSSGEAAPPPSNPTFDWSQFGPEFKAVFPGSNWATGNDPGEVGAEVKLKELVDKGNSQFPDSDKTQQANALYQKWFGAGKPQGVEGGGLDEFFNQVNNMAQEPELEPEVAAKPFKGEPFSQDEFDHWAANKPQTPGEMKDFAKWWGDTQIPPEAEQALYNGWFNKNVSPEQAQQWFQSIFEHNSLPSEADLSSGHVPSWAHNSWAFGDKADVEWPVFQAWAAKHPGIPSNTSIKQKVAIWNSLSDGDKSMIAQDYLPEKPVDTKAVLKALKAAYPDSDWSKWSKFSQGVLAQNLENLANKGYEGAIPVFNQFFGGNVPMPEPKPEVPEEAQPEVQGPQELPPLESLPGWVQTQVADKAQSKAKANEFIKQYLSLQHFADLIGRGNEVQGDTTPSELGKFHQQLPAHVKVELDNMTQPPFHDLEGAKAWANQPEIKNGLTHALKAMYPGKDFEGFPFGYSDAYDKEQMAQLGQMIQDEQDPDAKQALLGIYSKYLGANKVTLAESMKDIYPEGPPGKVKDWDKFLQNTEPKKALALVKKLLKTEQDPEKWTKLAVALQKHFQKEGKPNDVALSGNKDLTGFFSSKYPGDTLNQAYLKKLQHYKEKGSFFPSFDWEPQGEYTKNGGNQSKGLPFYGWTPPSGSALGLGSFTPDPAMLGKDNQSATYTAPAEDDAKGGQEYKNLIDRVKMLPSAMFSDKDKKTLTSPQFAQWFAKAPAAYRQQYQDNPGLVLDEYQDFLNGGLPYGGMEPGTPIPVEKGTSFGDGKLNDKGNPGSHSFNKPYSGHRPEKTKLPDAQETLPLPGADRWKTPEAPLPIYRSVRVHLDREPDMSRAPARYKTKQQKELWYHQQKARLRRIDEIINGAGANKDYIKNPEHQLNELKSFGSKYNLNDQQIADLQVMLFPGQQDDLFHDPKWDHLTEFAKKNGVSLEAIKDLAAKMEVTPDSSAKGGNYNHPELGGLILDYLENIGHRDSDSSSNGTPQHKDEGGLGWHWTRAINKAYKGIPAAEIPKSKMRPTDRSIPVALEGLWHGRGEGAGHGGAYQPDDERELEHSMLTHAPVELRRVQIGKPGPENEGFGTWVDVMDPGPFSEWGPNRYEQGNEGHSGQNVAPFPMVKSDHPILSKELGNLLGGTGSQFKDLDTLKPGHQADAAFNKLLAEHPYAKDALQKLYQEHFVGRPDLPLKRHFRRASLNPRNLYIEAASPGLDPRNPSHLFDYARAFGIANPERYGVPLQQAKEFLQDLNGVGFAWKSQVKQHGFGKPSQREHLGAAFTDDSYRNHINHVDATLSDLLHRRQDTRHLHGIIGGDGITRYSPSRAAHQRHVVDRAWRELGANQIPQNGQAVLLAGLPGSGKDFLYSHPLLGLQNHLRIDPDYMKRLMAEEGMIPEVPGLSPMEASPLAHHEASDLATRLAQRAYNQHRNVVWDTTLGNHRATLDTLNALHNAGYGAVNGALMSTDPSTARQRTLKRHAQDEDRFREAPGGVNLGGRWVPLDISVRNSMPSAGSGFRSRPEEVFNKVKGKLANTAEFSGDTTPASLLSTSGPQWGTKTQIHQKDVPADSFQPNQVTAAVQPTSVRGLLQAYESGQIGFGELLSILARVSYTEKPHATDFAEHYHHAAGVPDDNDFSWVDSAYDRRVLNDTQRQAIMDAIDDAHRGNEHLGAILAYYGEDDYDHDDYDDGYDDYGDHEEDYPDGMPEPQWERAEGWKSQPFIKNDPYDRSYYSPTGVNPPSNSRSRPETNDGPDHYPPEQDFLPGHNWKANRGVTEMFHGVPLSLTPDTYGKDPMGWLRRSLYGGEFEPTLSNPPDEPQHPTKNPGPYGDAALAHAHPLGFDNPAIGPFILNHLETNGGAMSKNPGLGRHWSLSSDIANQFALQNTGNGSNPLKIPVKIRADWRGLGEDPYRSNTGGEFTEENEVTMLHGAPMNVKSVQIRHPQTGNWHEVLNPDIPEGDIQPTTKLATTPDFLDDDEHAQRYYFHTEPNEVQEKVHMERPWHREDAPRFSSVTVRKRGGILSHQERRL